jgi:hypothetical protein
VATAWSERAAVLGRSYLVMEDAFLCILLRLPFLVLEIHSTASTTAAASHPGRTTKIEERRRACR